MRAPRRAATVPRSARREDYRPPTTEIGKTMIPSRIQAQIDTAAPLFVPTPTPRAQLELWQAQAPGDPQAPLAPWAPQDPRASRAPWAPARRRIDPEWVLLGVYALVVLAAAGTAVWAVGMLVLAVINAITLAVHWLIAYGPAIIAVAVLCFLLTLGGAKCAGLHCGGCRH